ncbi:MAG: ATP-dependent nuclease subunit [Sphingobacteriales bacterium]|nr:ATP-dependent nuclease subunit [Sphingobacteriales bacterium]
MNSFLREVATDLISRFGADLKDVAIIFNNKRPVTFLKKHLGELSGKAFWSPSFFTIGEFFSLATDLISADHIKQFFVLHQEFNKLLKEEGKPEFTPDQFYPMAEIILGDFSQIDYDLINPDQVFSALEDIAVIQHQFPHFSEDQQKFLEQFWATFSAERQQNFQQKFIDLWRRMPKLYRQFHESLIHENLTTTANLYRSLANGNIQKPEFLNDYKKLIFVGFNALNKAEATLFKTYQEQERAIFYFDADSYYVNDTLQEAGLFLRKNLQKTGLINVFEKLPANMAKPKQIQVIQAQGHAAQAKALNEFLNAENLASNADDPEKTAIIIVDESLLIPVLQTIPENAGKVNVTMGYPLAQSTVFGFIDLWLTIQEQVFKEGKDTIYYRDVQAFLSHPLSGINSKERDLILQRIIEKQWVEIPLTELLFASVLTPGFFTVKHEGAQCIDALTSLLRHVLEQRQKNHQLQQLEASLILEVIKKLNQLHDGLLTYASTLFLPFVFSLIRKALTGLSVPLEGEPLRGIQVMGLLESRVLDFEKVLVLGANEGVLPKVSTSPSFIPDSIRRAYDLPVLENQNAISAYLFYRLLHRSSDVYLVYNSLIDESNSGEPTRFLSQLEFESNYKFIYHRQQQTVQIEPATDIIVPKEGAVWKALQRFLQSTGKWDDKKISATALTTYLNCSLQFFFRYVAEIKEPEEVAENLEANQVGTILHQVLEWFYQDLAATDKEITAKRIKEKREDLPFLCRQALSELLFKKRDQLKNPNSMQQIILRIVEEYVNVVLDHDEKTAPFHIVELENKKDYKYRFPIEINNSAHEVSLYGIIDRVDEENGHTRIVDYKTGGRDDVRFSCLDDLFERDGKKPNKAMLQTLFYTYIYEQVSGKKQVEPNLYIIRKMKNDGTLFFTGSRPRVYLQAEHLEDMKAGFEDKLRTLLEELFDRNIPFSHTTNKDNCAFCPYEGMCKK